MSNVDIQNNKWALSTTAVFVRKKKKTIEASMYISRVKTETARCKSEIFPQCQYNYEKNMFIVEKINE